MSSRGQIVLFGTGIAGEPRWSGPPSRCSEGSLPIRPYSGEGRLAQRESTALTRQGSQVRTLQRPPKPPAWATSKAARPSRGPRPRASGPHRCRGSGDLPSGRRRGSRHLGREAALAEAGFPTRVQRISTAEYTAGRPGAIAAPPTACLTEGGLAGDLLATLAGGGGGVRQGPRSRSDPGQGAARACRSLTLIRTTRSGWCQTWAGQLVTSGRAEEPVGHGPDPAGHHAELAPFRRRQAG